MTCFKSLQGTRLRATKLDSCGTVQTGAGAFVVTKGFISVELELDQEDGQSIGPTLADGTRCFYEQTSPLLNGVKIDIEFCEVDPELFNLLTGAPLVTDESGEPIGFTTDDQAYASADVAIELWTNLATGSCPATPNTRRRWGYYLAPWVINGVVGKPKIENDAATFMLSGGMTKTGNDWGLGPYYIQRDSAGDPARQFVPLSTSAHDLTMIVNLDPPDNACGAQILVAAT